jgi:anti-sigma28 factor (negative regulator of flagellin synthesis)
MDIRSVSTAAAYGFKVYGSQQGKAAKKPAASHAGGKETQVNISATSATLQKIKNAIESKPEVRIAIVEDIKRRIETNDYPLENNMNEAIKRLIGNDVVAP